MKAVLLAIIAGLLLAIPGVFAWLAIAPVNGDDYLPPRCQTNPTTGVYFCIHYLPLDGRYEVPPAGVPADMARVAPGTATPFPVDAVVIRYAVMAVALTLLALVVYINAWSIDWRSDLASAFGHRSRAR